MLIFSVLTSVGCFDNSSNTKIDDSNSINPYEKIFGLWFEQDNQNNKTYLIVYDFLSNLSYFSGIYNINSSEYVYKQWGIYEMNNKTLFFNETGSSKISTLCNYSFSEDFKNLVLYFNDNQYFILTKAN